jgi:voltage-gated potassium channel
MSSRYLSKLFLSHVHVWLALAVAISGLWFLFPLAQRVVDSEHVTWFAQESWRDIIESIGLVELPRVMIALSLILMGLGLLARARLAWVFTLVLMLALMSIYAYLSQDGFRIALIYNAAVFWALCKFWSAFSRSSLAAGTLFVFASFYSLIWYATLGALYLGAQFHPPIEDLPTAAYFSVVAMSTVGFGDIVPVSDTARFFSMSIIVLGITVFATSLGAVIGPLFGGRIRQAIQKKARRSMRKNHVIICGSTPLALNVYRNLKAKQELVTVVVSPDRVHLYPESTDFVQSDDPSSTEALVEAGVKDASFVLALREDDSDNAFIVLAVKSFPDCRAKTVAMVSMTQNVEKVRRVHPDILLSPQLLGAELLSRALLGEPLDSSIIPDLFFAKHGSDTTQ